MEQHGWFALDADKQQKGLSIIRMNFLSDVTSMIQLFGTQENYQFLDLQSSKINPVH